MSRPLVSVLINNYNYQQYLEQAIDSAIAQDYVPIEIIVVDDGSTDDSRSVIGRYGSKIRAIFKSNGGQASAFNAGVNASRGDILCFLDSDDFWRPDKVTRVVEAYAGLERPVPLLVHHRLTVKDEAGNGMDGQLFGTLHLNPLNMAEYARKYKYIYYQASATSGMTINRSLAEMVFPLPENDVRTCADDFIVRAASLVAALYSIEPVLGTYRVHGKNHWFSTDRRMSPEFLATLDSYLNMKLAENGIEATSSYFDSMYCWWDLVREGRYLTMGVLMIKVCVRQRDKHTFGHTYRFVFYGLKSSKSYKAVRNMLKVAVAFAHNLRRGVQCFFG
jgi:glycosyltransferase involved in cell wall biosynthesis